MSTKHVLVRSGGRKLEWVKPPQGASGEARVKLEDGKVLELRFKRDASGVWLETEGGTFGFDLFSQEGEDGSQRWTVWERQGSQEFEDASVERGEASATASAGAAKSRGARVKAQMPGKIIKVHVPVGASVKKDAPLLVMEAMKMENEIRAPQDGVVKELLVKAGDLVESGAVLCVLEAAK